jgi:hypothetical protein
LSAAFTRWVRHVARWISIRYFVQNSVKAIDFLSIDIEGAEFDVLQTLDFEKWKPKIIVAEYNSMHAGKDYRLVDLLIPKGYALQHMTNSNFVFVAK